MIIFFIISICTAYSIYKLSHADSVLDKISYTITTALLLMAITQYGNQI